MEKKQQQQMQQQQTQAEINKAQADAAAAQQEVQQLQMEQRYQQQQQQQAPPQQQQQPVYVYASAPPPPQQQNLQSLPPLPPAIAPQLQVLEVFSAHMVDEESPAMKQHNIISVPQGARVRLMSGSLEHGLNPPYQDYVMVDYGGKTGKVSRLVLHTPQS
jgi:ATPase subunit of ABC transporter with duplicated ATPase domains